MKTKKIKAIFADSGGILIDDVPSKVREYNFLKTQGISTDYRKFMSIFHQFKKKAQTLIEYSKDDAMKEYLENIGRDELIQAYTAYVQELKQHPLDPRSIVFPGVINTLKAIQKMNLPFIIVTDSTRGKQQSEDEFYTPAGITPLITDMINSPDVGAKKPEPAYWNAVLTKHNLKPKEVIVIAHDLDEIAGAYDYGFHVAAMNFKKEIRSKLETMTDRCYILENFTQVPNLIRKINYQSPPTIPFSPGGIQI